jgi:hypothetical protein
MAVPVPTNDRRMTRPKRPGERIFLLDNTIISFYDDGFVPLLGISLALNITRNPLYLQVILIPSIVEKRPNSPPSFQIKPVRA